MSNRSGFKRTLRFQHQPPTNTRTDRNFVKLPIWAHRTPKVILEVTDDKGRQNYIMVVYSYKTGFIGRYN